MESFSLEVQRACIARVFSTLISGMASSSRPVSAAPSRPFNAVVIDKLADVNSSKGSWRIRVRIVRFWSIPSYGNTNLPYCLEMVLLDEYFFSMLREGDAYEMSSFGVGRNIGNFKTTSHEFKLNVENSTQVKVLRDSAIPLHKFSFADMEGLCGNDFDTTYLVDVIGMLAGVGTKREYEKEGKLNKVNVIELQSGRNKIDCALFGSYVDQLNNFLASGDLSNAVVIVQFARVKEYKGKLFFKIPYMLLKFSTTWMSLLHWSLKIGLYLHCDGYCESV